MISTTIRLIVLTTILAPIASATFSFNTSFTDLDGETVDYSIPASWGISDACEIAYLAGIPCDKNGLSQIEDTSDFEKTLNSNCMNECIDGFRKWRDNIRVECSAADIKAVTSHLTDIGFSVFDADGPQGAIMLASVANEHLPVVEMMYWTDCMRDLNTGEFCVLDDGVNNRSTWQFNDTSLNTPEGTTAFCNNNCLTQASAFAYEISGATFGTEEISIANVAVLCPDVDTTNYPVLLSEKPFSSFSFVSPNASSSASNNSSNVTKSTASGATAPGVNAAGSMKGPLWGIGSTVLVVAISVSVV